MSRIALARSGYPALAATGFSVPRETLSYYEGAKSEGRLKGWGLDNPGPNSATQQLPELRARSRETIRNNPYARRAKRVYVSNMVGRGIVARWPNDRVQRIWDSWMQESDADGTHDFYGLQALIAGTQFESGECLVQMLSRLPSTMRTVPLKLRVLEPDMLDLGSRVAAIRQKLSAGHTIDDGIERNAVGDRVAYWMRKRHPGDLHIGVTLGFDDDVVRVPAEHILHIYEADRPGQLRGVPRLAAVLTLLRELDLYEDAEILRKKIAALFSGFVKRDLAFSPNADLQADGDNAAVDKHDIILEPGTIQYLDAGESMEFAQPADTGVGTEPFLKHLLRKIAAGIGVTYEQLTNDLSGANYTSLRGGSLEFRREIRMLQQQLLCYQFNCHVALRWWNAARIGSVISRPSSDSILEGLKWIGEGWEWIDPVRDANGAILQINAGIASRPEMAAERGRSIEDIDTENEEAQTSMEERDLTYTTHMPEPVEPQPTGGGEAKPTSPGTTTNAPKGQLALPLYAENDQGERIRLNEQGDWEPLDES